MVHYWCRGRNLIWNVTLVDSVASSYLYATSAEADSAADVAAMRQNTKYNEVFATHLFVSPALESMSKPFAVGILYSYCHADHTILNFLSPLNVLFIHSRCVHSSMLFGS